MGITIDSEKVCNAIKTLLRAEHAHDAGEHRFALRMSDPPVEVILSETALSTAVAILGSEYQARSDTSIASEVEYETLVSEESRFAGVRLFRDSDSLELADTENGFSYRLGPPSEKFLVFFLHRLLEVAPVAAIRNTASPFRIRRYLQSEASNRDAMTLVRMAYPRLMTCLVQSGQRKSVIELGAQSNAFLFQLTYNTNVALVEMRSLDEFVRTSRLASMRRSRATDLEPPKRTYVQDLTYHYQLGVASESPVLEFLSFYHVAEHFFEAVFHDDLIAAIRDRITRPEFSSKRKKDVQGLIKEINKRQQIRNEAITFSELDALRLTLEKYVPVDKLREKLEAYEPGSVARLAAAVVDFCNGDAVDLALDDSKTTFGALARRVYRIRNAIVHSKDGEKARFVPFEHDEVLAREVPLMRFIAEEVIISTSLQL